MKKTLKKILSTKAKYNVFMGYGKCSKILSTFLFEFSNKMLVFRAGIHKIFVRIENRGDPDQRSGSALFIQALFGRQLVFQILTFTCTVLFFTGKSWELGTREWCFSCSL